LSAILEKIKIMVIDHTRSHRDNLIKIFSGLPHRYRPFSEKTAWPRFSVLSSSLQYQDALAGGSDTHIPPVRGIPNLSEASPGSVHSAAVKDRFCDSVARFGYSFDGSERNTGSGVVDRDRQK
jgi:hypothetical protein